MTRTVQLTDYARLSPGTRIVFVNTNPNTLTTNSQREGIIVGPQAQGFRGYDVRTFAPWIHHDIVVVVRPEDIYATEDRDGRTWRSERERLATWLADVERRLPCGPWEWSEEREHRLAAQLRECLRGGQMARYFRGLADEDKCARGLLCNRCAIHLNNEADGHPCYCDYCAKRMREETA